MGRAHRLAHLDRLRIVSCGDTDRQRRGVHHRLADVGRCWAHSHRHRGLRSARPSESCCCFSAYGKERSCPFVKHRREIRKQRPVGPRRVPGCARRGQSWLDLIGQERWGCRSFSWPPSSAFLRCTRLLSGRRDDDAPPLVGLTVLVGRLLPLLARCFRLPAGCTTGSSELESAWFARRVERNFRRL